MVAIPNQGKVCTKCGKWKYYGDYHKDRRIKSGLRGSCKACTNRGNKLSRLKTANPPKPLTKKQKLRRVETQRWYRTFNQERIKQLRRERYERLKSEAPEKYREQYEKRKQYWREVLYPKLKARRKQEVKRDEKPAIEHRNVQSA